MRFSFYLDEKIVPRLSTILKEPRTPEYGSIECFSYLKKHDLENYVKEEVVNPEGYEDKAQEGLSQIQKDYFRLH